MYPGYIAIGTEDPLKVGSQVHEVVNNNRAYAYAKEAGIDWLYDCDACPSAGVIVPGGPRFRSPIEDPAPWYRADNPDSNGFLGVIGIEVTGAENSTRQSTVTMGLTGGGIIGPSYMGPRTMVLRAIAIATDECSLQYGMTWLRTQFNTLVDPCSGDPMTFFDCCPCICEDEICWENPCWAVNYRELRIEPSCDPDYWPDTYSQLKSGPPNDDEWHSWPRSYLQLRLAPPGCGSAGGPPVSGPCWAQSYLELRTDPKYCNPTYWPDTYAEILTGPPDTSEWCDWPEQYHELSWGPGCGPPSTADPGGVCWPVNYHELTYEPPCNPDYWPTTYGEIKIGPPADSDEWCAWPEVYYTLRYGPPAWSCCVDECVVPYMRQFRNARVTTGPTVLSHPVMHTCGALAEIEFTIVAADPTQYTMPYVPSTGGTQNVVMGGATRWTEPAEPEPAPDPWALVGV